MHIIYDSPSVVDAVVADVNKRERETAGKVMKEEWK